MLWQWRLPDVFISIPQRFSKAITLVGLSASTIGQRFCHRLTAKPPLLRESLALPMSVFSRNRLDLPSPGYPSRLRTCSVELVKGAHLWYSRLLMTVVGEPQYHTKKDNFGSDNFGSANVFDCWVSTTSTQIAALGASYERALF